MRSVFTLALAISLCTLSCKDKNPVVAAKPATPSTEDVEALYQQFHGKYQVVSATSSEPLDVNFDGVTSTDLLQEIGALKEYGAFLELRVKYPDRSVFLFSQFWPEQYVHALQKPVINWNGWDALAYNPAYSVMYAQQAVPYSFSLNKDLSQVLVKPNAIPDTVRWVKPESVFVEPKEQLRLLNRRRFYTREGVKQVLVTTVYRRFTMTT